MIGFTTGLDFSATYSDYATVTLGYGFSTNTGVSEDNKATLIYLKHTGRLGLRLDI